MARGKFSRFKDRIIFLSFLVLIFLFLIIASSAENPPQPFGIAGYVYQQDSVTQAPSGTPFSVRDINSSDYVTGTTGAGPYTGRYSVTVNGYENDTVIVKAWNLTHYGRTNVTLVGDMDTVNVTINLTRASETNVTVTYPQDSQQFFNDTIFTLTAVIQVIGSSGISCSAAIWLSNESVVNITSNEINTKALGSINMGEKVTAEWNVSALLPGTSDINVTAECSSDNENVEGLNKVIVSNITVVEALGPPEPHGIAGWIFQEDGATQVELGTPYRINDTTSGLFLQNETKIPFPGYSGYYSETIEGNDGDDVIIHAWNSTHYGETVIELTGDMDNVNVTINLTRPSETNVTILYPTDYLRVPKNRLTNVTASVQIIGGSDGENCSATIFFSNESLLNISPADTKTHILGNITLGNMTTTVWNVSAWNYGLVNITVTAECGSDGWNFDRLSSDTVINVNITVPALYVKEIQIEDPINLEAGISRQVYCNATIVDENYAANITSVNATLFDVSESSAESPDDNNNHYTNASCLNISMGEFEANYTCSFSLWYYANNGTWRCNITVYDFSSDVVNTSYADTTVSSLYAISADPFLDYGTLLPGEISSQDSNLTFTNEGNQRINVSVEGYGITRADGLGMICSLGNMSVELQHYYTLPDMAFSDMNNLTNESVIIANYTLHQRTDDSSYGNDRNRTFWKTVIPFGVKGFCNGTILAGAVVE